MNDTINNLTNFHDAALIRREMFENKCFDRKKDGSFYWRVKPLFLPEKIQNSEITITTTVNDECEILQSYYNDGSYLKKYFGDDFKPDYIKTSFADGNLPPNGQLEFYRLKSIYYAK